MTTQTIQVPAASTGKGIRIPVELIGEYGDQLKEDGQEAVSFATGGVFTSVVATDGSYVDFFAVGETGSDTATIGDEGENDSIVLTVAAETPASLQIEAASIIEKSADASVEPGTAASAT